MLSRLFSFASSLLSSSWISPLLTAVGLALAFMAGWKGNGLVWEAKWEEQRAEIAQDHAAQIRMVRDEEAQALAASEQARCSLRDSLNEVQKRYEDLLNGLGRVDNGAAERVPDGERNAAASADAVPSAAASACRPCRPCDRGRAYPYVEADKALEMAKERDEFATKLNALIEFYNRLREKQAAR